MTTLDDLRAARDAAIVRWTNAAGGRSLCRLDGPPAERGALKRLEGEATALRQLVRRIERDDLDPDAALTAVLDDWQAQAAAPRNEEWRAYAEGGRDALLQWDAGGGRRPGH